MPRGPPTPSANRRRLTAHASPAARSASRTRQEDDDAAPGPGPSTARALFSDEDDGGAAAASSRTTVFDSDQLRQLALQVADLLRQPAPGPPTEISPDTRTPHRPEAAATPALPLLEPAQPPAPPPPPPAPMAFRQDWIEYLRTQRLVNGNFSKRDQEEVRTLLLACTQPPQDPQDQTFLQDRLKLFLVVAHRGWQAALSALPDWELVQLGVTLPPPPPVFQLPPSTTAAAQHVGPREPGPARRRRKRTKEAAKTGAD